MKPLTIKVGTLIKIGVGVAALNFAMDLGKATMFKAFKISNPEEADKMMDAMDAAVNTEGIRLHKKIRLKVVKSLCKTLTEE